MTLPWYCLSLPSSGDAVVQKSGGHISLQHCGCLKEGKDQYGCHYMTSPWSCHSLPSSWLYRRSEIERSHLSTAQWLFTTETNMAAIFLSFNLFNTFMVDITWKLILIVIWSEMLTFRYREVASLFCMALAWRRVERNISVILSWLQWVKCL